MAVASPAVPWAAQLNFLHGLWRSSNWGCITPSATRDLGRLLTLRAGGIEEPSNLVYAS